MTGLTIDNLCVSRCVLPGAKVKLHVFQVTTPFKQSAEDGLIIRYKALFRKKTKTILFIINYYSATGFVGETTRGSRPVSTFLRKSVSFFFFFLMSIIFRNTA